MNGINKTNFDITKNLLHIVEKITKNGSHHKIMKYSNIKINIIQNKQKLSVKVRYVTCYLKFVVKHLQEKKIKNYKSYPD